MHLRNLILWAALASLAACGGAGPAPAGETGDNGGGGNDGGGDPPTSIAQESQVVVRYDHDGDGNPDHLTLDTSATPYVIVEAVGNVSTGAPVDLSGVLKGQAIDPEVSDALANYLAGSIELGVETDLDVVKQSGDTVTITVFE